MEDRKRPKIKICGIRTPEEAKMLSRCGADYAGLVFYPPSKRFVTDEEAGFVLLALDHRIQSVAVTVSPDTGLCRRIEEMGFSILQVHGSLEREILQACPLPIWLACNISDEAALAKTEDFLSSLDKAEAEKITGIVLDGATYGGGQTFAWEAAVPKIRALVKGRKLILAGGLREENIAEGIRLFSPDIVDVSSGVEGEKGKDENKVMAFCRAVDRSSKTEKERVLGKE